MSLCCYIFLYQYSFLQSYHTLSIEENRAEFSINQNSFSSMYSVTIIFRRKSPQHSLILLHYFKIRHENLVTISILKIELCEVAIIYLHVLHLNCLRLMSKHIWNEIGRCNSHYFMKKIIFYPSPFQNLAPL
jgi:hypothetical protein